VLGYPSDRSRTHQSAVSVPMPMNTASDTISERLAGSCAFQFRRTGA
jgi:hypothetical protein